jgi:hypothetical protein
MILHQQKHPGLDVEGCFGCRLASIRIGGNAMPTRRPMVQRYDATEKQWQKDIPAYRTLRAERLQPRGIDGAHELMMRAETREQVEGLPKLHADQADILTGEKPITREAAA